MPSDPYGVAIEAARRLIASRGKEGRHHVAATVITASGAAYTAVHLESALGRAAICAEAVAIGMAAAAEDDTEIIFSAAVNQDGHFFLSFSDFLFQYYWCVNHSLWRFYNFFQ